MLLPPLFCNSGFRTNLLQCLSLRRVQMMKPRSDCLDARATGDAFTSAVLSCPPANLSIRIAHDRYQSQFQY